MTGLASITFAEEETALASMQELVGADGQVKREFLVLPYGNPFFGRDGRGPWIMRDRAHAERVLNFTRQTLGGVDMMIDYDHASELAAPEGKGRALAAGWVKDLQIKDDGIWASVDWTPQAEGELASRQYRYISPYFRVSKATREVTRLVNAGLTNTPNLDLPALAHQRAGTAAGENPTMTMIALAPLVAALALASTAGETEVLAAIGKLKAERDGSEAALNAARTELGLGADAGSEAVLAAVQAAKAAGKPDPAQYVPKAGFDQLQARLATLEEARVLASVDDAVASGKLPPAMKDWALELGKKDEAALNSYLAAAVPFAGGATIKGDPKPEKGKLTDEERAICSMLGVSEAEFLKTRDEEAA